MKYEESESSILEFKLVPPDGLQVVNTLVAFANTHGGRLVFGVRDDREIIGLSEETTHQLMESLAQSVSQKTTPPLQPYLYSQRKNDQLLVIVEVSRGRRKPYFLTTKGLQQGVYIRLGSQTVKATSEMIDEIQWQSRGFSIDTMPVYAADPEELDLDAFGEFLSRKAHKRASALAKQMLAYGLALEEHGQIFPTTAGLLLFGASPQKYLTEAFVICTHFEGVRGRKAIATRDSRGTLFQQIDDTIAWIHSRLNKEFRIDGAAQRAERLEVPEDVIREMIVNAVIHRNYQIQGPNKVAIFDDRIEIFSPGSFPGPLVQSQLDQGFTFIRNRVIGRVMREIGVIEKLGSGLMTLFERYRERDLPRPEVIEGAGFVKVILPRQTPQTTTVPKSDDEERLMRMFLKHDEVKVGDVITLLEVSRSSAVRLLRSLIDKGQIERIGAGPAARYRRPTP